MGKSKVIFGNETIIDLTSDTVNPNVLLRGYTAHNAAGDPITGQYSGGSGGKGQAKIITPAAYEMVIFPDEGYDNLSQVILRPVPYTEIKNESGGIIVNIAETENEYNGTRLVGSGKSVTPSTSEIEILPDEGEDYFSDLTVNAIPYTETQDEHGGIIVTIGE